MNYESINVGILSNHTIRFILNGDFISANGSIYSGKQKAKYKEGKVYFNDELFEEIIFKPLKENDSFDLINVIIGINFHWERKENQRFKGALKFIVEDKNITAINVVEVEDYLTSVISSEMSATASEELLKAHAVISRSWLLCPIEEARSKEQEARSKVQMNLTAINYPLPTTDSKLPTTDHQLPTTNSKLPTTDYQLPTTHYQLPPTHYITKWYERDAHTHFDVCADDHCQRYQGITKAGTPAVKAAIEATRGEVLMYEDKICDARFSKSCGGITESFENSWAPVHIPYLTPVIDNTEAPVGFDIELTTEDYALNWIRKSPAAFCNTTDKKVLTQVLNNYDQETTDFYRWKVEYTQKELSELICRKSGIDFGDIIDLIPVRRGESGRIIELQITGTKQTYIVGKELEIRKWLSDSHLYSSAFVADKFDFIDEIPQRFILTGAGWGHGVGLCQIGAAVMGEKGYMYKEILQHYFKGAELKKIY
jgi:stage II sporulation protein D